MKCGPTTLRTDQVRPESNTQALLEFGDGYEVWPSLAGEDRRQGRVVELRRPARFAQASTFQSGVEVAGELLCVARHDGAGDFSFEERPFYVDLWGSGHVAAARHGVTVDPCSGGVRFPLDRGAFPHHNRTCVRVMWGGA